MGAGRRCWDVERSWRGGSKRAGIARGHDTIERQRVAWVNAERSRRDDDEDDDKALRICISGRIAQDGGKKMCVCRWGRGRTGQGGGGGAG